LIYGSKITAASRGFPATARLSCISDVRTPHAETETLKQFRRVEKYANEAETVSVFYFSFISPCATGLILSNQQPV